MPVSSLPGVVPNPVYSTFAFVGFLFCSIPFAWHLEAWNTGTCLYMFWVGLDCLVFFINSIVWNANAINWAPVWCDISARIILANTYAVPAASLCINRRLYQIASIQTVTVSRAQKRRAVMVDLAIGMGYPLLMITLQYIVQGHRFNIYEDVGCLPWTYVTPPALVLVQAQPILIGLISALYCVMSIRLFMKWNAHFDELLSGHRNLNKNRYTRLMCLAGMNMVFTVPLATFALAITILDGVQPWLGWEDTHRDFSRVDLVPAVLWRPFVFSNVSIEFARWSPVLCAFIFFGFFGFAEEAKKHYRSAVEAVAEKVGYPTLFSGTSSVTDGAGQPKDIFSFDGKIQPAAPLVIPSKMLSRHRSIDSRDTGSQLGEEDKKNTSTELLIGSSNVVPKIFPEYGRNPKPAPLEHLHQDESNRSPV